MIFQELKSQKNREKQKRSTRGSIGHSGPHSIHLFWLGICFCVFVTPISHRPPPSNTTTSMASASVPHPGPCSSLPPWCPSPPPSEGPIWGPPTVGGVQEWPPPWSKLLCSGLAGFASSMPSLRPVLLGPIPTLLFLQVGFLITLDALLTVILLISLFLPFDCRVERWWWGFGVF